MKSLVFGTWTAHLSFHLKLQLSNNHVIFSRIFLLTRCRFFLELAVFLQPQQQQQRSQVKTSFSHNHTWKWLSTNWMAYKCLFPNGEWAKSSRMSPSCIKMYTYDVLNASIILASIVAQMLQSVSKQKHKHNHSFYHQKRKKKQNYIGTFDLYSYTFR